jgi:plastocyanin
MPAAVHSITIVPGASPGAPATFSPSNLVARAGDVVSWNNTTQNVHQIWQLDGSGDPMPVPIGGDRWPPITPGQQSPAWTIPGSGGETFQYGCLLHFTGNTLTEIGTITT